jgi:hypothetical protein
MNSLNELHAKAAPVVNVGGTSPEALKDGIADAMDALATAYAAVLKIAPHARDYAPYALTHGNTALDAALRRHKGWLSAINKMQVELCDLVEAVDSQVGAAA